MVNTLFLTSQSLMKAEISVMRSLDHPQLTNLTAVYEDPDTIYFVIEKLNGGDLGEKMREITKYSEKNARKAIKNIYDGLVHLHSKGFVHRDIHPANIVIRSKEDETDLVLSDFGIAAHLKEGEMCHLRIFCRPFVSPESINGDSDGYDFKQDVFAVGVILYFIMTGSHIEHIDGKGTYDEKKLEDISPAAQDFLKIVLENDQYKRATAAEALKHEWFTDEYTSVLDVLEVKIQDKEKKLEEEKVAKELKEKRKQSDSDNVSEDTESDDLEKSGKQ